MYNLLESLLAKFIQIKKRRNKFESLSDPALGSSLYLTTKPAYKKVVKITIINSVNRET